MPEKKLTKADCSNLYTPSYRVFHLRMCFLKGLKMSENQYVEGDSKKRALAFLPILSLSFVGGVWNM